MKLPRLLLICCVAVVGCSEQPSDANKTYLSRLSSTLQTTAPQPEPLKQLDLVAPRSDLQPTIKIGITELAGISQCNLNILISEHNNQLGKTATPASQLKYQLDFIQSAQSCLQTLDKKSNVYNKITSAKQQKQSQLSRYFNHVLYGEPELKRTWQLTSQELKTEPAGFSETLAALKMLNGIKHHIEKNNLEAINSDHILSALEAFNRYNFNQQLIQATREQIILNRNATQFVNSIALESICPKGKNKQHAIIVSNIFNKFYLKQIQLYQAQLTGYLEILQPLYKQLWFEQPITSDEINRLLDTSSDANLIAQLKSSAKEHVIWWQNFYKTCELSPI